MVVYSSLVQGHPQHLPVIEGQTGQVVDREPPGLGLEAVGGEGAAVGGQEGHVGHADHPAPGIPPRIAEGVELLQVDVLDPGGFAQLPQGRLLQALPVADETAGQGPEAGEGLVEPLHQDRLQLPLQDGQDHRVDGDREGGQGPGRPGPEGGGGRGHGGG